MEFVMVVHCESNMWLVHHIIIYLYNYGHMNFTAESAITDICPKLIIYG